MLALKTFEQTAVFDPNNPDQAIREAYVPGGYQSFYFNEVPTTAQLRGLGSLGTMPAWAQIAVVALGGAAAGYFAMSKWGDKLKPTLRKIPVFGKQFAGLNGRHRRR
jgi:hypothetical protein